MGSGGWTTKDYINYSASVGRAATVDGLTGNYSAQELFRQRTLDENLDPMNAMRECCDTEEHPRTIPIILALDVTGSMGGALAEVAKRLNVVMTDIFKTVRDAEVMVMGIGDLAYDRFPIQASQFESDVRVAEWLDKIFFERGGGGNSYESYTAAWYFGAFHTKLDCWERGERGILITVGDEPLNPYLPGKRLRELTGGPAQDMDTGALYETAKKKYDIYHLAVADRRNAYSLYKDEIRSSFGQYLDDRHLRVVNLDSIASEVVSIVANRGENATAPETEGMDGLISW